MMLYLQTVAETALGCLAIFNADLQLKILAILLNSVVAPLESALLLRNVVQFVSTTVLDMELVLLMASATVTQGGLITIVLNLLATFTAAATTVLRTVAVDGAVVKIVVLKVESLDLLLELVLLILHINMEAVDAMLLVKQEAAAYVEHAIVYHKLVALIALKNTLVRDIMYLQTQLPT
jgi:hypothetical protein